MSTSLDWISKPAAIKAIQFAADGNNYDHVINIIRLNKGQADLGYVNKDGQLQPKGTLTEFKVIVLVVNRQVLIVPRGSYLIIDPEGIFPMQQKLFEEMNIRMQDIDTISNGLHTFRELYAKIAQYEPTLEQVLVSDKASLSGAHPEVLDFIIQNATILTDSDGRNYYLINGIVYTLD